VRLLVQPGDGVRALVKGITAAKSTVEIVIFRFDQREVEQALASAVSRGVAVNALIASTNSAGEENLRKLELRLLGAGVTVARTQNDLIRYHSKFMIVDRRDLYLLAFNWTHQDIDRSRSFALIVSDRATVQEAVRLFEADTKRIPYEPVPRKLIVSPVNARKELTAFIKGAKKSLAIYDPQVSDRAIMRVLEERAAAGVTIRIIGKLAGSIPGVEAHKLPQMRLHTRTMVRDGNRGFLGSQSLREAELDSRREVGLIFRDAKIVSQLLKTFESDWAQVENAKDAAPDAPAEKLAKKVAKAITKGMPEVAPILSGAVQAVVGDMAEGDLVSDEMEQVVRGAVKQAVKAAVRDAVEDVLEKASARAEQAAEGVLS
jgi:cardiolipin synthase